MKEGVMTLYSRLSFKNDQGTGLVHYSFIEADPKRIEAKQQAAQFLKDPMQYP
jgi:hypothetical protein